ncbi:restriction endonuclease subunit S [Bathymodiolus thermophilus thioautotrophic gill symbiont]|uniref:Type I restriction modification DNA specificity domain-containing protein n=1 Tax=Bathymodiolus thermophilus thioautotrophic gill symbiont TaxID=2360 RepID=A0A1J5TXJ7_9GAMM|nr:restriction endonuclease subunit S [Bathymodiolus thermophilus thioautotrophic gill symbiont]OIR25528.1 hypothetical protein BGC33_06955 [Bathymodiolus thermophilus thioautotrophic gill symbiont]
MGNFQLSKQVDPNKIFLTKFSELEGRFDPLFCLMRLSDKNLTPIKNIAIVKGGKRIPKGKTFSFEKTKYKYFRVKDFDNCRIDNLKNISEELFNFLKRYEVKDKNLIISIAGTIGKTILFANNTDNRVILTENSAKIILISSEVTYEFLNIILQTELLQQQIMASSIQTTIPKLGIDKILQLKIPIPSKNIQANIVMKMDKAYQNKKNKEIQAQNLLNSIDDYLLDELGIELFKEIDNSLKARVFTKKLSDVVNGRFDAGYYQKKYINFENVLINKGEYVLLKKILQILESGSRPTGGVGNIESGVLSFGGTHVSSDGYIDTSKAKYIPIEYHQKNLATATKIDDLLLVKDGATTGKIAIIQKAEHENQNINEHVFLMRLKDSVNPIYLLSYLKSSFGNMQIKREITGATVTGLTKDVVNTLKIPLPPLEKQNQIAKHIGNIRKQAKQLQTEAKIELEQAKQEIEAMILSEKL